MGGINIEESRLESGRMGGNVLHDGSDEVENEFAKFGDVGMDGRETMVSRIIRADNMVVVSLVEVVTWEILLIVMKELRVGSFIRQRVQ